MINTRQSVAALTLSAAAYVAMVLQEGYSDKAIIPVEGDRPTVGFGSTFRDDGTPVKPGDTITPPKAVQRSYAHIAKDESQLKRCVTAPLLQREYDAMVNHAYQYGAGATCTSEVVRLANAQRYEESCKAHLNWRKVAGRDCSIRSNGCYGVWLRSQERARQCLGEGA